MDGSVAKPGSGNGKTPTGGAGGGASGGGAGPSIERDLRAAVDQIAAKVLPERGRVTELIRMHSSYHSSYPIDELSIGFADGSVPFHVYSKPRPPTVSFCSVACSLGKRCCR